MMSYPEFLSAAYENVEEFLEKMEVACISNHIQTLAQILHLLQLCLKEMLELGLSLTKKSCKGLMHLHN